MKNRYNKGFTLIEFMIILAIVGILASAVIPIFQGDEQPVSPDKESSQLKSINQKGK